MQRWSFHALSQRGNRFGMGFEEISDLHNWGE
jgi:hypothetical protein